MEATIINRSISETLSYLIVSLKLSIKIFLCIMLFSAGVVVAFGMLGNLDNFLLHINSMDHPPTEMSFIVLTNIVAFSFIYSLTLVFEEEDLEAHKTESKAETNSHLDHSDKALQYTQKYTLKISEYVINKKKEKELLAYKQELDKITIETD